MSRSTTTVSPGTGGPPMKRSRLSVHLSLACAIAATGLLLVPKAASARPRFPHISSVSITGTAGNYTVTVMGHLFGSSTVPLPFTGDVANFHIQDNDQLGLPGAGQWGYSGDTNTLTYAVWTSSEVRVTGVGLNPGDSVFLVLQNGLTGLGASWGGNVPGAAVGTPVVNAVGASSLGHLPSLRIAVTGHGFGAAPRPLPFVGDLDQFYLADPEVHCGGASALTAGGSYFGTRAADAVT